MDAISADVLSACGVVLDQKSHIARYRKFAKPRIQGRVGLGACAQQHASHVGRIQGFRQESLDRGGRARRKCEVEPATRRSFSHHAASACLSLRNDAVLSVIVANRWPRLFMLAARHSAKKAEGRGGGGNSLLNIVMAVTTLSRSRPIEGARADPPKNRREAARVKV
ncbi:MAG TPA: hypothetical protein VFQ31_09440 [Methyloceanibacter sp.]|nr:hypothetical protein [Methyloceanibacter sp.]